MSKKRDNWFWALLKHPLFVTFVGLLITIIAGGLYDSRLQERRLQAEQRVEAMNAAHNFLQAASERRSFGSLVVSGIRRGINWDSLVTRKIKYDDSYVEWNRVLLAQVSVFRFYFGSEKINEIEEQLNERYLPWFRLADACLTRAYDAQYQILQFAGNSASNPEIILQNCGTPNISEFTSEYSYSEINRALHGCEIALLEGLIVPLRKGVKITDDHWKSIVENSKAVFHRDCRPDWGSYS